MEDRGSWKVGLVAIVAIVGIVLLTAFLLPGVRAALTGGRWSFYIVISDVGGLQSAENVMLSGVEIGTVKSVTLVTADSDDEGRVVDRFFALHRPGVTPPRPPYGVIKVSIENDYRRRLFDYYAYEVAQTSLIGTTHEVDVKPMPTPRGAGPQDEVLPGTVILGAKSMSLTDITVPASGMMSSVSTLSKSVNSLISDPAMKRKLIDTLDQMHSAAANLNATTSSARDLAARANGDLVAQMPRLNATMANFQAASGDVLAATGNMRNASTRLPVMMDQVQGTMAQVRGNLTAASQHANLAVQNIEAATGKVKTFVNNTDTLDQLHNTVQHFQEASQKLDSLLANMNTLTARPEFQNDLPATLHNLREASGQLGPTLSQTRETLGTFQDLGKTANQVLTGVNGLIPKRRTGPHRPPRTPAHQNVGLHNGIGLLYSPRVDRLYPHRALVDPAYELALGGNLYDIGLFDVGGSDRLTLEMGRNILGGDRSGLNGYFGLYRGKAGVALGWVPAPRFGLYGTLYDANMPSLDLEGAIDFSRQNSLWAGIDEVNRHPRAVVGIRVKP